MLKSKIKFVFCSVLLFEFHNIISHLYPEGQLHSGTESKIFCYSVKWDKYTLNRCRTYWLVSQDPVCYVFISAKIKTFALSLP